MKTAIARYFYVAEPFVPGSTPSVYL